MRRIINLQNCERARRVLRKQRSADFKSRKMVKGSLGIAPQGSLRGRRWGRERASSFYRPTFRERKKKKLEEI